MIDQEEIIETDAQKIKRHLDTRGVTYTWLADQLGVTPAWVTRIFNGSLSLTPARKQQVQQILNIDL